ncbi:hypothetical protein BDW59DRAFT_138320 [Aspergillus cavernicola]|uniref:Xylanolytic transcriptional activator regulatory domain-containing protein n=1 Tax=Aspergillus cavernicola TaxID=176166 RepID=A0ABR4J138_9EURO
MFHLPKKKKRCRHLGPGTSAPGQILPTLDIPDVPRNREMSPSSRPSGTFPAVGSTGTGASLPSSPGISRLERFVGDLNPEAAIREKIDAPAGTHLRDRVGLWINAPISQRHEGNGVEVSDSSSVQAEHLSKHSSETQSVASILHARYSSARKACDRLPRPTLDHLLAIYFSKVNHILPLVDHESFIFDCAKGATSVFLEKALCLVAAKDRAAGSHLRLTAGGPLLTARQFCSDLYNGLACAMDSGLERDRVTRIRILALMSLHSEGYEGAEAASMQLCQAIHLAQTAGLHLERPNRLPGDSLTNLFWCLWTLDKMHASIGGRPVLLADRDIGIKRPDVAADYSKSAFDVWFALSSLLSKVISFYRPSADDAAGWETDYPSFEEIIGDHVREDLDFPTLGVLELYYHAISILSARYRPSHRPDGSRPSYTRQGLAAVRIYSLVATECAQNLSLLPIVPYAVALSMGVSYHQLRSSKIITHFDRAKGSLDACCTLLEELGVCWYSAEAMARLGRKALRQIEGTNFENNQSSQAPLLFTTANSGRESLDNNASSAANQVLLPTSVRPSSYSSETHRPLRDELPTAAAAEQSAPLPLYEHQGDLQSSAGGDGFADIDMLFDDFLDLSLPTNFWDPVFLPSEHSDDV